MAANPSRPATPDDELCRFTSRDAPPGAAAAWLAALTAAERRVLDLIAAGQSNSGIAERLSISPKTVRNHINHIFDKLGVTERAQAIVQARNEGFGRDS